jgi:hypothetical protein
MKRYLLFCQLALLPPVLVQAQFTAENDAFFIKEGTQISIDGLTLLPSIDFSLASQTLTISHTPIPGTPPSIAKVYSFSSPVAFAGIAGFYYLPSELNGNSEHTLQLTHGNALFVATEGSTVNVIDGYISNTLPLTNFTSLTAAQQDALPVKLIDFQVKRLEFATVLQWKTSVEKNSDYFEIQQSEDIRTWNSLGRVHAARESDATRNYSFSDDTERNGTQYYRLKMVDKDNSYAYSAIRSIRLPSVGLIRTFPNPVVDQFLIDSHEPLADVKITDLSGRLLLQVTAPESREAISLKGFAVGIYLVKIETRNGRSQVIKVIKN